MTRKEGIQRTKLYRQDWCLFAREVLRVNLDPEQEAILRSVQINPRTSVRSGTSRGKDFVAAVACLCFLYLTPKWDEKGDLIENTKVAMTAPTGRQVKNIMFPEISRIFNRTKGQLPGRLAGSDIRTGNEEWFLTGFKADEHNEEAWTGFHAVNTMFVITEASGISENIFGAIEGNLQGNSRILIVFNPNKSTGYAAQSQKKAHWQKFKLSCLSAPNVLAKKDIYPGQVGYNFVKDQVLNVCEMIGADQVLTEENDFQFEIDGITSWYRPNDWFRRKILGEFPKVSSDVLIPESWVELAFDNYDKARIANAANPLRLGSDIAGMGRDNTCDCHRYGNWVEKFVLHQSGGAANHMESTGRIVSVIKQNTDRYNGKYAQAFIDTIGEGAGVFSRLEELNRLEGGNALHVYSVKASYASEYEGKPLKDITGQNEFSLMRDYLYWAMRDWLNPINKTGAGLPRNDRIMEQLTTVEYSYLSNGKIKIEPKEDIKDRLGYSPDEMDALSLTFYPAPPVNKAEQNKTAEFAKYFF